MEQKLRILIVHNRYQIPGGEDTVVKNEMNMLKEHGHTVFLYERNNSELNEFNLIQKVCLPFTMIYSLKTVRDIKKLIQDHHIDVVHVHNTLLLVSHSVYYMCKKMNIPVVQTVHNFRFICPNALLYRDGHICEDCLSKGLSCAIKHNCYRGSKLQTLACVISMWIHRRTGIYSYLHYICLTEFNKQKLLYLPNITEKQIRIKPNVIPVHYEVEDEKKEQFICVGRLDQTKGIRFLIESWIRMGKNAPKLIVYGNGPEENWCHEQIKNYQLSIELRGYADHKTVMQEMACSKALILPTQLYEGFPMALAEAYSIGLPVIGSEIGNTGSLIKDGLTGWTFDPTSSDSLIQVLQKPLPERVCVKQHFETNYSLESNYKTLLSIYEEALK